MWSLRSPSPLCVMSLALLFTVANSAHAAFLDGKKLTEFTIFGDSFDDATNRLDFIVGPWVESEESVPRWSKDSPRTYDFSDTQLAIHFPNLSLWTAAPLNGPQFVDTDASIAPFASVSLNAAGTNVEFDTSRIIFDEDSLFLNFQGLTFQPDSRVVFDIIPVCEPVPSLLLTFGVAALTARCILARRRQPPPE